MGKNLFSKAMDAITKCMRCQGTGKEEHYVKDAAEVMKNGRTVAYTKMAALKTCTGCGGTGRVSY
ncbi:hypothetical protein [Polymorphospora sp. NPDC050346]|uniref:hypothetical protein n=1 Tax=Polymorphospora sp. NPDC050346 TaxID=3155780 RepID=UPI0033EC924D